VYSFCPFTPLKKLQRVNLKFARRARHAYLTVGIFSVSCNVCTFSLYFIKLYDSRPRYQSPVSFEDGGSRFVRNIATLLANYAATRPGWSQFWCLLPSFHIDDGCNFVRSLNIIGLLVLGCGKNRGFVKRFCLFALLPISLNCLRASKDKVFILCWNPNSNTVQFWWLETVTVFKEFANDEVVFAWRWYVTQQLLPVQKHLSHTLQCAGC
jgi:hypothetical protein